MVFEVGPVLSGNSTVLGNKFVQKPKTDSYLPSQKSLGEIIAFPLSVGHSQLVAFVAGENYPTSGHLTASIGGTYLKCKLFDKDTTVEFASDPTLAFAQKLSYIGKSDSALRFVEFNSEVQFAFNLKVQENIDQLKAIEVLYVHIYDVIREKQYSLIDRLAINLISFKFRLKIIVAFLTITHSIKNKFSATLRANLIRYANSIGVEEGLTLKQINSILKGF